MPPVYEFSNPFFFSEEKMRMSQGSGSYTEIHKDGEAGIYFAVKIKEIYIVRRQSFDYCSQDFLV